MANDDEVTGVEKKLHFLSRLSQYTIIVLTGILTLPIIFSNLIKEHLIWFHPFKFRLFIHFLAIPTMSYIFIRFWQLLSSNSRTIRKKELKEFRTSQLLTIGYLGGSFFFLLRDLSWFMPQSIPSFAITLIGTGLGLIWVRLFSAIYAQRKKVQ